MEKNNETGILISVENSHRSFGDKWFPLVTSILVYLAFWSAAVDMAGMSLNGAAPLGIGLALTILLVLFSQKKFLPWLILSMGTLLCFAMFRSGLWDGLKLLVNRFFEASQQQEAYIYQMLPVSVGEADEADCIRAALLFLGTMTAPLCAAIGNGRRWIALAVFLLAAMLEAYLGVSPSLWSGIGLLTALGLSVLGRSKSWRSVLIRAALFLALTAGIAAAAGAWTGENPKISMWEESIRDQIALETIAHTEHWEPAETLPPPQAEQEDAFYREEDALSDVGGDTDEWAKRLPFILLVVVVLLVLFIPSILADIHRSQVAKNRQGLEDPDNNAAIRAMFLYAFSWLKLGGLQMQNVPYSAYAGELGERFSDAYAASFQNVLPLWQGAAYSPHAMTEDQREQMRSFMNETRDTVLAGMNRREKLAAKYIHAME